MSDAGHRQCVLSLYHDYLLSVCILPFSHYEYFQGKVRVLALIVKLFSVSNLVASAIYNSNLLNLFEAEINNTSDTLVTLSVLELLYEVGC